MHEDSEDQAGFQQTLDQNFGANKSNIPGWSMHILLFFRELESTSED